MQVDKGEVGRGELEPALLLVRFYIAWGPACPPLTHTAAEVIGVKPT